MTPEIALVLVILGFAVVLFVTERIKMDVVALLVLGSLAVTGLVTPAEALSGFSNPAVVTVWAMFIISGGLSRTGVANMVGRQVLRMAGEGEVRLMIVIMVTAGVMSAFMNNVGVAAMMLPVVMDIARRMERPPSRLLMPLAFQKLAPEEFDIVEARLLPHSSLIGQRLYQSDLRRRFGVNVLAIQRKGLIRRTNLQSMALQADDILLLQGARSGLAALADASHFDTFRPVTGARLAQSYRLHERFLSLYVPPDSILTQLWSVRACAKCTSAKNMT